MWKDITEKEKKEFNKVATHPLQAFEWGEFRKKTGIKVVRKGLYKNGKLVSGMQITIHNIPKTPFTIGYFPKGTLPTKEMIEELKKIGEENKCIFIQLEPNIVKNKEVRSTNYGKEGYEKFISLIHDSRFTLLPSAHPLFTKYTFQLDLTKSEEELLKQMNQKTRYNIRVAQKHGVQVTEETSQEAFQAYLTLTNETTNRQGFFAHTPTYHKLMWDSLKSQIPTPKFQINFKIQNTKYKILDTNILSAHLLIARYQQQPLTTWILFTFHDTLYYPYGASSSEHRETMASNLMMWEAIKYGKRLGLTRFDLWGSLGENPDTKDPWYGFHRFKQGYGPTLVEFAGSYDLVCYPILYQAYKVADKLRWAILKIKGK